MSQNAPQQSVQIVKYSDEYAEPFARLNLDWLIRYELIEDIDREYVEYPREKILDKGGEIFLALIDGKVVGTASAVIHDAKSVELAKLAVDQSARGRGIGQLLTETVINWAREKGAEKVVLISSTKLKAALRLYERLGFIYCPFPADTGYETADIYMELDVQQAQNVNAGGKIQ